jgi:hypothetical protein
LKGPLAALASCLLIAVVFLAINAAMRSRHRAEHSATRTPEYIIPDDTLGWRPQPSTRSRAVKMDGDQVIYDVVYAFDEHGRRSVPQDPNARYEKFLIFFGDSGTFGEGVDASQSLPAQTAAHLPGVRAYNYAFPGYGPQHILAKVESTDLRAEIPERRGVALYPFSKFLFDRLIGGSGTMGWAPTLPYYVLDGDGVRRDGFFQTARPIFSRVLKVIGNNSLLQRLNVRWPLWITDEHRELFCRVIATARDSIRRQLPGSELIIVLNPNDPVVPYPCFAKYKLRVIDVRGAYGDVPRGDLQIHGDGHPTPLAHELIGTALAHQLEAWLD